MEIRRPELRSLRSIAWALILSMVSQTVAVAREPAAAGSRNELAPGNLLQIRSSRDANLNGEFRVDFDGKVALPYEITLDVNRKTISEFRAMLDQAYRPYFTGEPNIQATVKLRSYWVDVRGIVARPGRYLVKRDSALDDVLSQAGGLTEKDTTSGFARIEQGDKTTWVDLAAYFKQGDQSSVPKWQGADRIFFQKERPPITDQLGSEKVTGLSGQIHVLGEVRNPGEQKYREKADGYQYLIQSGGPTTMSDLDKVEVVRPEKDGSHRQISIGPIADVRDLQAADLLIVHPSRPSAFERFLQNSALTASILSAVILGVIAAKATK